MGILPVPTEASSMWNSLGLKASKLGTQEIWFTTRITKSPKLQQATEFLKMYPEGGDVRGNKEMVDAP